MPFDRFTRRESLRLLGTSAAVAASAASGLGKPALWLNAQEAPAGESPEVVADRARRMQWWHQATFGMFIHWGLYSVLGHHEWAMEKEGIPVADYENLAKVFKPQAHAARAWARLAKQAGQKYMVMTTKHHEGFCQWDTKLTTYCAPKQGPGRDLVAEYLDAARSEGMRVGFYYSLMDWHHPDGARCATDDAARERFVEYTHSLIRELMTNYGKIDILWYDVDWPLTPKQWRSQEMNEMVFKLQPDIIVNDRNGLPGDFSTPEQEIVAAKAGRGWETCMTMNDSWGYQKADDNWKSTKTILRNLADCARGAGNYLLNIGPKGDGSIPEESVRTLTEVGRWMSHNSASIYAADRCHGDWHPYAGYSRKGNTLYIHVHFWPGQTLGTETLAFEHPPLVVAIGGLRSKVTSARLLASDRPVKVIQDDIAARFVGLPVTAPDEPVTVIAAECDSEPVIDSLYVRKNRPRHNV
jgi:alpha-L-fucosidase